MQVVKKNLQKQKLTAFLTLYPNPFINTKHQKYC